LTTLSLFHLAGGLLARDQRHTIFDRAAVPGPTQLRRYGIALLLTVAVTGFGFLQRLIGTTSLDFSQWWICIGAAASLVVMEELIKFFIRRRDSREARIEEQLGEGLEPAGARR
jgi:Ca2+-transporting ATPase